ncbi:MAG TPA: exodeoxyribonuclease VII large subunit, partial [Candidatus Coprenecus stercoravium]|nr:exodeoxyribonuclease VII large subunit [Candidatus Coprenecus stercoravium]
MREYVSLSGLLQRVKEAVSSAVPAPVWVRAEIHEIRIHGNGHCYME